MAGSIVAGSMMSGVGQYVTEMFEDSFQIQGMAEVRVIHILTHTHMRLIIYAPGASCAHASTAGSTTHATAALSHRRTWLPPS